MHGEFRHLVRYRKVAETMGYPPEAHLHLLHSGDVLEMTRESAKVIGQVQAGRVHDRRPRGGGYRHGRCCATASTCRRTACSSPSPASIRKPAKSSPARTSSPAASSTPQEAEELIEDAKEVVRKRISELTLASSTDMESAKSAIRTALNRFVYERTKRRPMVIPVIMEV